MSKKTYQKVADLIKKNMDAGYLLNMEELYGTDPFGGSVREKYFINYRINLLQEYGSLTGREAQRLRILASDLFVKALDDIKEAKT